MNISQKLEYYTNGEVTFNINWATKKIKSLFKMKDNIKHLSCVIYQGICSCGKNYVGETMRNATTGINEREQPDGKSETSKHLKNNLLHKFDWTILSKALSHRSKRKILDAYFIKQLNPSLTDYLDSKIHCFLDIAKISFIVDFNTFFNLMLLLRFLN